DRHLDRLHVPRLGAIEPPGRVEGGDVFLLGRTALIGVSARTNDHGRRQLARILTAAGYHVRSERVPAHHLHLGSVLSPVAPDRVVSVRGVFSAAFLRGLDVIEAPPGPDGGATANVLCLAPDRVLA